MNTLFRNFTLAILSLILLSSCAVYEASYHKDSQDWETLTPPESVKIEHTMYLIGDAGKTWGGEAAMPVQSLGKTLKGSSENSSVIFLGDNIYQLGMPPESEVEARKRQKNTSMPNWIF